MIKISTAQKESIKLSKPSSLKSLSDRISLVYDVQTLQLLLTYENEEEELVLLNSEDEYTKIHQSSRDFHIKAYIHPLSQKRKYIYLSIAIIFLTYCLVKFSSSRSIEVNVHKNSEYLISFFGSIFSSLYYIIAEIVKASLWVPSVGTFGHFVNLIWTRYRQTKTMIKTHLAYLFFFMMSFIDFAAYYITMFFIVWFVLVYFHLLLNRPKPRTDRVSSMLRVLALIVTASILRLISFE